MTTVALIIAIVALMLSIWGVINVMGIFKTLNVILDIFKLQQMQDSLKKNKELTPEQRTDIERMQNERH